MNPHPKSNPSNPSESSMPAPSAGGDANQRAAPQGLLPTPSELVALLSARVVGQHHAKQSIAVAVYQHFINCARSDLVGTRVEAENHVLLAGPSGTGKSLLLRTLSEVLKIPLFHISCANITPDGYKGKNFAQHLDTVASKIVKDERTRPAIVVFDELDKLSLHKDNDSSAAVYRGMIQAEFLTYLDGSMCGSEGEMDSSRLLTIACGAFVGLNEICKPAAKALIGFKDGEATTMESALPPLLPEHLISYGLIPELVGRFSRIATLDPLDHRTMRRILTEAENNVLARRKEFYAMHGIRLEITDDAIDEVVAKALAQGTGARALGQIVDQILRSVEHRLPDMAEAGVRSVVLDKDAVLGLTTPIEHTGQPDDLTELREIRRRAVGLKQRWAGFGGNDENCCE